MPPLPFITVALLLALADLHHQVVDNPVFIMSYALYLFLVTLNYPRHLLPQLGLNLSR